MAMVRNVTWPQGQQQGRFGQISTAVLQWKGTVAQEARCGTSAQRQRGRSLTWLISRGCLCKNNPLIAQLSSQPASLLPVLVRSSKGTRGGGLEKQPCYIISLRLPLVTALLRLKIKPNWVLLAITTQGRLTDTHTELRCFVMDLQIFALHSVNRHFSSLGSQ